MIGSINSYLAGILVAGHAYRVDHAPDGPSSPIWLSDDAIEGQVCSCCGEPLIDFDEDEEWFDEPRCLFCGEPLGYEEDSDFCDENCAQAHCYSILL